MKKLFTIFTILFFALSFGQNQTFSGIKTFTSPPKFLNLSFSGTNTKYLTINAQGQLQFSNVDIPQGITEAPKDGQSYLRNNGNWVVNNIPSATPTPSFQQVLDVNNNVTKGFKFTNTVLQGSTSSPIIDINCHAFNEGIRVTQNTYPNDPYTRIMNGGLSVRNNSGQNVAQILGTSTGGSISAFNSQYNSSVNISTVTNNPFISIHNGVSGVGSKIIEHYADRIEFKGDSNYSIRVGSDPITSGTINGRVYTFPVIVEGNRKIALLSATAPTSATDVGVVGEIRVTATYIYTCVAANTWVRAAVATW